MAAATAPAYCPVCTRSIPPIDGLLKCKPIGQLTNNSRVVVLFTLLIEDLVALHRHPKRSSSGALLFSKVSSQKGKKTLLELKCQSASLLCTHSSYEIWLTGFSPANEGLIWSPEALDCDVLAKAKHIQGGGGRSSDCNPVRVREPLFTRP